MPMSKDFWRSYRQAQTDCIIAGLEACYDRFNHNRETIDDLAGYAHSINELEKKLRAKMDIERAYEQKGE